MAQRTPTSLHASQKQATMEASRSTSKSRPRRAETYVTVTGLPPAPTASHSISPTTMTSQAIHYPSSSVPTATYIGTIIALVSVIILIAIFLFVRLRQRRQQSLQSPPRAGTRSISPAARTGTGLSGQHRDPFPAPLPRPYGAPTIRPTTPKPYLKSDANRRDAITGAPAYPNRIGTPTRAATASPANPPRTRTPTSRYANPPPITVSPPRQQATPTRDLPQKPNAAFLRGHPTRTDLQDHLTNLQMLSDTTDMSTDTVDGPEGRRQLVNPATAARHAKAAAEGRNVALLASDASEYAGDSIYGASIYGPTGRRVEGVRTWETHGSGIPMTKPLNTTGRSGSDGQEVLQRARPVKRNQF